MRVLFIAPYPTEGPSNRYRVEQYLPYIKDNGIDYSLRPFVSSDFFKIMYKNGHQAKKVLYFLSATTKRLLDLIRAVKYDLIFVHIESFPFGPAIFEKIFVTLGKPIIYDFEDAVYLPNFRGANRMIDSLRCNNKFYQILRLSSHIIVCNRYMKELVSSYNPNVTTIPTSIDTDKFRLKNFDLKNKRPVIGWIGSHTTAYYLRQLEKVFMALAKKYDFSLKIIGGNKDFSIPGVNIINEEWDLKKDVDNFQQLDIGIYPLPSDERAMAKTPFKTIQYMSVGVPAVVSRVGGNIDIVQDGINGFLASNDDEWVEKLSLLIENPELRRNMGLSGRKTVEEKYSLKVNVPVFLDIIQKVYEGRRRRL